MYRRKIGKKIFRRTRKHKFYGIKAKNRPSMLTRRRVRRGGEGDTVIIEGIRETDPNSSLSKETCDMFAVRANDIAVEAINHRNDYKFSDQAKKDSDECETLLSGDNIEALIAESMNHLKLNLSNTSRYDEISKRIQADIDIRNAKEEERRANEAKKTAEALKNIQTFNFFRELIGQGKNNDAVVIQLDMLLTIYLVLNEQSKKIYKTIFSILIECIKFNDKNGVFIEKISIKNLDHEDDYNLIIYPMIARLLYSLAKRDKVSSQYIPDFLKYYNSFFENDQEKLGYTANKPKPLDYINVNKVLRILYSYYGIIISTLAQYSVVLNVYSVQLETISDDDIRHLVNDKFRSISISAAPEASTPPQDTTNTANLEISNDVLLNFLLTDFTLNTEGRPKIPVDKEILVRALTELLGFQVSFFVKNKDLNLQSENLEKVFSLNQPLDQQLNILKDEPGIDDKLLTYSKHISWVKKFLLLYANIFCFYGALSGGLKTETDVRKNIEEKIIVRELGSIDKMIQSGEIFKTPQMSEENTNYIVEILKKNTQTDKKCNETLAFTEFKNYAANPSSNSYYLGIFCNMVIYACYMSTSKDSSDKSIKEGKDREDEWGEKGTDLMIIYMNIFIIKYVNNLLEELSKFITPFLEFLDTQYQRPPNTYIFYGLGILSSQGACKNAKIILKQIKTTFNNIYQAKFFKSDFKQKYDNIEKYADTYKIIIDLESLLSERMKPFNEDNTKLLEDTNLKTVLCLDAKDGKCNVFEETIKPFMETSDDPSKIGELQKILSINENNLHRNVAKVCNEILPKLIESMSVSKSKKDELKQSFVDVLSYLPKKQTEYLVDNTDTQRKKCELMVADIISTARKYKKKGQQLSALPDDYYQQMDICANYDNVFEHQKTNETEYKKRIARAYYGIKEMLDVSDPDVKKNIENLNNFKKLKQFVEYGSDTERKQMREMMLKQCKDDHKGVLGYHNQTRELIKAGLSSDEINKKCDEDFDYVDTSSDTRRKECEMAVATIINKARRHKPTHDPILLKDSELNMIDICANPNNVFEHQIKNPKEFYKRIARAYYGITEILAVCDTATKEKIENLPNFIELKKKVENVSNFDIRQMIREHCKDDHKGVLGFHNQTRELIKAGLPSDEINKKCNEDFTAFTMPDNVYRVFQNDLNHAAEEVLKKPGLTLAQKKKIRASNALKTAMMYVNILSNPQNYKGHEILLKNAKEFLEKNPTQYVMAEALVFLGKNPPNYQSENINVQKIIDEREILKKEKETARNDESFLSNIMGSFDGGTTSIKARHKYSRKAKHQPNTKRKNKSKSKSKSRVKSRTKTIKKNKRARRKFYKKYTRKH